MSKALIYILFHPAVLVKYDVIRREGEKDIVHIMVVCEHPYSNRKNIDMYSKGFNHIVYLPCISYEANIFRGAMAYFRFLKKIQTELTPILENVKSYSVVSDFSAFLPVNALLSKLKKNDKFNKLITLCEDYVFEIKPDILRTAMTMLYTLLLGLQPAYYHKVYFYTYFEKFHDKIIQVISPFEKRIAVVKDSNPLSVYSIIRPVPERCTATKDTIIFYSDTGVRKFGCGLSNEEYSERLEMFFKRLSAHYHGHNIICKPHPLDIGKPMIEMGNIKYVLCEDRLISQVHLDMNFQKVKACYSVASTSLLYSASLGIPSYTLYKYLGFNERYPTEFFKTNNDVTTPFLYEINSLDEIGIIDSIKVEPKKEDIKRDWNEFMEWK